MPTTHPTRDHLTNQPNELGDLHCRMARLEASNRRLKVAGSIVIFAAVALVTMGSTSKDGKTVTAESFVVVDKDGNERAFLGTTPADGSVLILRDRKKNARVSLASAEDGTSAVLLANQTGTPHVLLRVRPWSAPSIELGDGNQQRRLKLALDKNGEPAMSFMKVGRNPRMKLSLDADGNPGLTMMDDKFRRRVEMALGADGEPRFELVKGAIGGAGARTKGAGDDPN